MKQSATQRSEHAKIGSTGNSVTIQELERSPKSSPRRQPKKAGETANVSLLTIPTNERKFRFETGFEKIFNLKTF